MPDALFTARRDAGAVHDIALLLLRLILGVLILLHGVAKIAGGADAILGAVANTGLPAPLGYLVYIGEVLAPILVIVGLWTRAAAIVIAINMIVAILLVHASQVLSLAKTGGWALELQGLYLIVAICVALLGAGRYSLGGRFGPWN
ncbi:MAG TPA: DoxX family protein [Casimicrobiaceae bacterium]|nr:DoxX family protein [Casimicrobiaceae bacterium]